MKQKDEWKARSSFSSNPVSQHPNFNWKGAGLDQSTNIKERDIGLMEKTVGQYS
jgi:hypothetical protein